MRMSLQTRAEFPESHKFFPRKITRMRHRGVHNRTNMAVRQKQIIPFFPFLILEKAGYQAYLVGGCVRDLLRGVKPKDWDITTDAKPEEIQKLFLKTFYENKFGTVAVVTDSENESLKTIEITPFRLEAKYTDKRHPDKVEFTDKLEDDLKRRDFTINAIALQIAN